MDKFVLLASLLAVPVLILVFILVIVIDASN
jgi:hypothetical protein